MLLRHNVDRLGRASSASNKSGSCASILTLHTLVGATICGAQTDAAAQVERVARRNRRFHARTRTPHEGARVKVAVSCAAGLPQGRPSVAAPASHDSLLIGPCGTLYVSQA